MANQSQSALARVAAAYFLKQLSNASVVCHRPGVAIVAVVCVCTTPLSPPHPSYCSSYPRLAVCHAATASIAPWAACSFMTPTTPHRVCLAAVRAATDATRRGPEVAPKLGLVLGLGLGLGLGQGLGLRLRPGPSLVVIGVVFAKYFYASHAPFPKLALRQ